MGLFVSWIVNAVAVYIAAVLVPGVEVSNLVAALFFSAILGLINTFVKPVLILFTLPITVLTLGLFILVVNALLIMLAGYFVNGFSVSGFIPALFFSIILAIVNSVLGMLVK